MERVGREKSSLGNAICRNPSGVVRMVLIFMLNESGSSILAWQQMKGGEQKSEFKDRVCSVEMKYTKDGMATSHCRPPERSLEPYMDGVLVWAANAAMTPRRGRMTGLNVSNELE